MNWRQFTGATALSDAQAYCDQQTALMKLPSSGVTTAWAVPMELMDGSYVVPAYEDSTAVPWNAAWTLASN